MRLWIDIKERNEKFRESRISFFLDSLSWEKLPLIRLTFIPPLPPPPRPPPLPLPPPPQRPEEPQPVPRPPDQMLWNRLKRSRLCGNTKNMNLGLWKYDFRIRKYEFWNMKILLLKYYIVRGLGVSGLLAGPLSEPLGQLGWKELFWNLI